MILQVTWLYVLVQETKGPIPSPARSHNELILLSFRSLSLRALDHLERRISRQSDQAQLGQVVSRRATTNA